MPLKPAGMSMKVVRFCALRAQKTNTKKWELSPSPIHDLHRCRLVGADRCRRQIGVVAGKACCPPGEVQIGCQDGGAVAMDLDRRCHIIEADSAQIRYTLRQAKAA